MTLDLDPAVIFSHHTLPVRWDEVCLPVSEKDGRSEKIVGIYLESETKSPSVAAFSALGRR